MNQKIRLISCPFFLTMLNGCLTFRYSVTESRKILEDKTEKRELGVVRIEASQGQRTACYVTFVFYGGYCWFVSPNEDSEQRAVEKGNALDDHQKGSRLEVRYLGRD